MSDERSPNFIRDMIAADVANGKHHGVVATRFPPEPNGYLHIGHAKAICLNFQMATEFGGTCKLRFDDTNPEREDTEFVESIKRDIRWLGFEWEGDVRFTSDYFPTLYQWAEALVESGKAYVDSLTPEEIREYRGDFHNPGRHSPYRDRSVQENLDLLRRMKAGEFPDAAHVLRAKIDMASGNLNLRDPTLYRIKHAHHHRTGDTWCLYPMYDFAHGQSDAIEHITHSLCSLEFEAHRPLYDWLIANLPVPAQPEQTEFGRLNLTYTVLSKRKLRRLVEEGFVAGWDDPRMPTISGMRRRGFSPASIRSFCDRIGVSKRDGVVDVSLLEHAVRDDLNRHSPRLMAVFRPLKVVIENFEEGRVEWLDAPYFPEDDSHGSRRLPLSRELYIEHEDFKESAPRKWFRLAPGREVRLRYACLLTCREVVKDDTGEVVELRCTWDPQSLGGAAPDGRRVKGTLHWVSAAHSLSAQARLYDRLFTVAAPDQDDRDFIELINPDSLVTIDCRVEPDFANLEALARIQCERVGYFCVDSGSTPDRIVLNRTIGLRDTWGKIAAKDDGRAG